MVVGCEAVTEPAAGYLWKVAGVAGWPAALHNNIDKHKYGVDRLSPIGPLRFSREPGALLALASSLCWRTRLVLCVSELDPLETLGRNCGRQQSP